MDGVDWLRSSILTLTHLNGSASSIIISILIVLFLIFINGFFSASEMAIITLNDNKVRKLAEAGNRTAIKILYFIDHPGNFLATIQVGVTFAGFLSSAIAGDRFGTLFYNLLDPDGSRPYLYTICLVGVTLVLSYLSLVFGELVPKRIAMSKPETVSKLAVNIIRIFDSCMRPFTRLLNFSTNLVLKILGIDIKASEQKVTEEELRMMIDVSSTSGGIESEERKMLQNIFDFNDKEVSTIMVHRKNISALPRNASYDEALEKVKEEGYTRLPVYDGSIDDIIGIINMKDLLYFISKYDRGEFDLSKLMREPLFTPESKSVDALFRQMQKSHEAMAIVIDEYGGVAGLVTMEDLIEEIVGNIQDEYDDEHPEIVLNGDGSYTIDGMTSLDDMQKIISDFSYDEDEVDSETIAGLMIHQLDRIPEEDEFPAMTYKNFVLQVLAMDDKRIAKVHMKRDNDPFDDETSLSALPIEE